MIEALISSKTRIKLLLKFFLNGKTRAYLRSLEQEFGESTNGIRIELNRLEEAGMLTSSLEGNRRYFQANRQHPLYDQIHQILLKTFGIDHIIDQVVSRLGDIVRVYLTGDLARGMDSPVIDLLIIGNIDRTYLAHLVEKTEPLVDRKIRTLVYAPAELPEDPADDRSVLLYQSPGS